MSDADKMRFATCACFGAHAGARAHFQCTEMFSLDPEHVFAYLIAFLANELVKINFHEEFC